MKKIVMLLIVVALLAAGWYWLRHRSGAPDEEKIEKPVARVETTSLERKDLVRTLEAYGIVATAPSGERTVAAPYDCIVRKVDVAVGMPVVAGQVLLEIGPGPDAQLALDSARSVHGLAKSALGSTQERFDLKLATSPELLGAQQAEADARLKVSSLEARGLGGDGIIRANSTGTISRLDLAEGALVPTGTPLVGISSAGALEVRLGVEAGELSEVQAGQKVVLRPVGRAPAAKVISTVRTAGGTLDATTGAGEVRVPVPPGSLLLPGEHVVAAIEVEEKVAVLAVPRRAVLASEGKAFLFAVKNNHAVRHEVRVGLATDEEVEVTGDGLQVGDAIVVLGNYELEDNMEVQVGTTPAGNAANSPPEARP